MGWFSKVKEKLMKSTQVAEEEKEGTEEIS